MIVILDSFSVLFLVTMRSLLCIQEHIRAVNSRNFLGPKLFAGLKVKLYQFANARNRMTDIMKQSLFVSRFLMMWFLLSDCLCFVVVLPPSYSFLIGIPIKEV